MTECGAKVIDYTWKMLLLIRIEVMELLDGKGGSHKGVFSGKTQQLKAKGEAAKLVKAWAQEHRE